MGPIGVEKQGREERVYRNWGSRLYWSMQTGILMTAALLAGLAVNRPLISLPVLGFLAFVLLRQLRMGIAIHRSNATVRIRRVFRDLSLPFSSISHMEINDGSTESVMWGRDWDRLSAVLVLKDDERIWVNGMEFKAKDDLKQVVDEFNSRLPGGRK